MTIDYPNDAKEERIEALARGLVQVVPIFGGLLAEGFTVYLSAAEERKRAWGEHMSFLVSNIARDLSILPETLAKNERFLSVLIQATAIAFRNSQKEKLAALSSAVISAVDERFDDDDVFIFLRYVDELTPTHLKLLSILDGQETQLQTCKKLDEIYEVASRELASIDRTLFRVCVRDLSNRSLLVFDDIDDYPEYDTSRQFVVTDQSKQRPLSLTDAGRQFLTFITKSPSEDLA